MAGKRRFSFPKAFLLILIAALGMLGYKLYLVSYEKYQINKKSSNIQEELQALVAKNAELKSLVSKLEDKEFLEKEARKKLNVEREGEKTVIITAPKGSVASKPAEQKNTAQKTGPSNFQKWFEVLFGK